MSANKNLVLQMVARFNALDADGLDELVTDSVKHSAAGTAFNAELEGRAEFLHYMKHDVLAKFERVHFEPYNIYEDRDANVVTAEWRGDFVLRSGRTFSSKGAFVVAIVSSRIDWVRDYFDTEKTRQAVGPT